MTDTFYLGIKSLHVIAIISWMAGLLYLPRLFVYHTENKTEISLHSVFTVMERRLYGYIMTPAMVVSWISGLIMMFSASWFHMGWMHGKLCLVFLMTVFHFYLGWLNKKFAREDFIHKAKFYRLINEIPTLLMIGIVCLVLFKAF
jgi:protoporphyrinogen IX oxidase